jgi:predicted DNA-binding mobile mystery protein A
LSAARAAGAKPARGWLRAVREAVGLSQAEVAGKMTVKRQSYAQFEEAEERGSISLASMRRAAEAMDCELVYFVVPRESVARSYAELAQIHDPTAKHLKATDHSMALKGPGAQDDAR